MMQLSQGSSARSVSEKNISQMDTLGELAWNKSEHLLISAKVYEVTDIVGLLFYNNFYDNLYLS